MRLFLSCAGGGGRGEGERGESDLDHNEDDIIEVATHQLRKSSSKKIFESLAHLV